MLGIDFGDFDDAEGGFSRTGGAGVFEEFGVVDEGEFVTDEFLALPRGADADWIVTPYALQEHICQLCSCP